jgi:hypothetical protein
MGREVIKRYVQPFFSELFRVKCMRGHYFLPSLHANGQDLILGASRQNLSTNMYNITLLKQV